MSPPTGSETDELRATAVIRPPRTFPWWAAMLAVTAALVVAVAIIAPRIPRDSPKKVASAACLLPLATDRFTGIAIAPNGDGWITGMSSTEQPKFWHLVNDCWVSTPPIAPAYVPGKIALDAKGNGWAIGHIDSPNRYTYWALQRGQWRRMTATWVPPKDTNSDLTFTTVHAGGNGDTWFAGLHGLVAHLVAGSFVLEPTSPNNTIYNLAVVAPNDLWAVGADTTKLYCGTIWHRVNGTWQNALKSCLQGLVFNTIQPGAQGGLWAAGSHQDGSAALFLYNGQDWAEVPVSPDANEIAALGFSSATLGIAVGANKTVLQFDGQHWSPVKLAPFELPFDYLDIAIASSTEAWAIGGNATIIHYLRGNWFEYSGENTRGTNESIPGSKPSQG